MRRNVKIQFDGNYKVYEFKNPTHTNFRQGDKVYVRNSDGQIEEVTVYDASSTNHKRKARAYPSPNYFFKKDLIKVSPILPNI